MKTIVKYILAAIILTGVYGVYHSLTQGRCVDHSHSLGVDGYILKLIIYFILLVAARAVYRYYQAVNR